MRADPKVLPVFLLAGAMALAIAGCSDNPGTPEPPTDEEVLSSIVTGGTAGGTTFAEWFDLESTFGEPPPARPLTIPLAPISVARWFREPARPFTHTVEVTMTGDSAFVHLSTTIAGTLNLYSVEPLAYNTKPFTDHASRNAVFHRYADSTDAYVRGWRLEQISNIELVSSPEPTVQIDQVILTPLPKGDPIVIDDPLVLLDRRDVPHFMSADSVAVEVHVSGDVSRAFLHMGAGLAQHHRVELEAAPADDQIFYGVWTTEAFGGVYHIGIDVVRSETLGDDDATTYPYDSNTWILLYWVSDAPIE